VTRVVSLTPSRVERDTRTFKEASSFARHGLDSVVVEALPSRTSSEAFAFRLETSTGPGRHDTATAANPSSDAARTSRSAWRRMPAPVRLVVERALRVPLTIASYLAAARRDAAILPAADLYWLHGYPQFPQAWLAARREGVPLVYDAHDFYPQVIEGGEATALERLVMRGFYLAIERASVRAAAEVVTVSDGVANLIADRNGRRPIVVRNCAELRGLADDGPDVRSAAGLAPDDFLVVMPGNHKAGMRAVDEAIDAFARLPDRAHLAFVGDGYGAVAERVERLGMARRVHLLPAVPAADVPAFIRSADAVAVLYLPTMPAIEFALPNGFFAAIVAGLPLLWPTRLPEIRRLAEEHGLGVAIEPEDPASIVAGVLELLDEPRRAAALRENVRLASEVLNWETEERRLFELVARLTKARS
jgi:glycosyltransferase involved in cell wall biosynthesis